MKLFLALLLVLFSLPAVGQTQTEPAQGRKYRTTYKLDLYKEANFRTGTVGSVPANVILEELAVSEGYIQVSYKGKTGWVMRAELKRHMDIPAPDLKIVHAGYKIIGSTYRYFFAIRNDGVLPYKGEVTLRLFDQEGKTLHDKTTGFQDAGIEPEGGGGFFIDLKAPASSFEFEHSGGKVKSNTGRFIERL